MLTSRLAYKNSPTLQNSISAGQLVFTWFIRGCNLLLEKGQMRPMSLNHTTSVP